MSGQGKHPWWIEFLKSLGDTAPPPEDFGKGIPNKEWLTFAEAAPHLNYKNVESLRRLRRQGDLPVKYRKSGGQYYILRSDLIDHLWHSRKRS